MFVLCIVLFVLLLVLFCFVFVWFAFFLVWFGLVCQLCFDFGFVLYCFELNLKGSYDVAKKDIILCIWCNAVCLRGSRFKEHIVFQILYIIVAPLCSAFLKRVDF